MAKLTVFHDFHETELHPILLAVRFTPGELDWSKHAFYIPLTGPFEKLHIEGLTDTAPGISVLLEDLVTHERYPRHIGVSLSSIRQRHAMTDCEELEYMWIRYGDIEEVLQIEKRAKPL